MLIDDGHGGRIAGPLDVIMVLRHKDTRRYHVCFAEEHMFPGPVENSTEVKLVRLKSKMHHTAGADTLEVAHSQLNELRKKLRIRDENVWREPKWWNGNEFITVVGNWLINPRAPEALHAVG